MRSHQSKLNNRSRKATRKHVHGIALIEALVSILIFTTGILGVIGLQAAMMRAQGAAKYRADASALAGELIGRMWGDSANAASANLINYASTTAAACTHEPCAQWLAKVATSLPKGTAVILADAITGGVTVTISWTLPTDGLHTYVTTTAIR
jgi:type IV pilus assembly protein PilV